MKHIQKNFFVVPGDTFTIGLGVPTVAQQDGPSLQCQDLDSTPSPAQQVKGSGLAAIAACRLQLWLASDPWAGSAICHGAAKKEKDKFKEKKYSRPPSDSVGGERRMSFKG